MKFNTEERQILTALDQALRDPGICRTLNSIADQVIKKLQHNRSAVLAWDIVPLEIYKGRLAEEIRSSWVFVLRAGAITGAERHPNSRQRMMSWKGTGDFQIMPDDKWISNHLLSDPDLPLERRWISIPVNVWHQAAVPDSDWVVVSFHTVPANELIEERPSEDGGTKRNFYVAS
jgi:hypothetical protein